MTLETLKSEYSQKLSRGSHYAPGREHRLRKDVPIATSTALEPEVHYVVYRCADLRTLPVKVGLFRREQREKVLICFGIVCPLADFDISISSLKYVGGLHILATCFFPIKERCARRSAQPDEHTYGAICFTEDLRPIIWWQGIACSVSFWLFPDIPRAFGVVQGGARLFEPLMLRLLARQ